jgi:hypothetical protein
MDAPTPIPEPAEETPTPSAPHTSRRRTLAAAGLAAAVGIAGLGAVELTAAEDDVPADRSNRIIAQLSETATDGLGAITLDALAEELAELGLEVTITPNGSDHAEPDGAGTDDEPLEDADAMADAPADSDPFAGMTDAEIEALSDDEFFALLDEAGWTIDEDGWIVRGGDAATSDDRPDGDDHDHDAGSFDETSAVFTVDGDEIAATSGDADAVAEGQAIWQRFVELIPEDQRSMLIGFEVIAERGGGGYVYPDESDPTKWHMGISPGLGADEDWVLIHEFAHLLTLQAKEVPPSLDDGSCPTYHTGEGCSLKGSTMNEFVERFWPQSQIDEIFTAQENEDWEALERFYEEHQDDFVTDYATTNPAEDLAETFTVFVLNDRPTGDTIAEQKVEFLWSDADLVELRAKIRAAL